MDEQTPDEGSEPYSTDAYFTGEANRLEAELQQLVAEVNDGLTASMATGCAVSNWQVLHFLHVAQRLLEGVHLAQQIAGYLVPIPEEMEGGAPVDLSVLNLPQGDGEGELDPAQLEQEQAYAASYEEPQKRRVPSIRLGEDGRLQ